MTLETGHSFNNLCLQSTNGGVSCSNIAAQQMQLMNDSGSIDGETIAGTIRLNVSSGFTIYK